MVDFRYMTKRQQKKYKEVIRKFPNLLCNEVFMHYITETSIEGSFNVSIKEDRDIIGFSGFNDIKICPYYAEFTFYRDKSFVVNSTETVSHGDNSIKFLQYVTA
jgi:hypothetical protein